MSSAGDGGSAWPCYSHLLHHCITVSLGDLRPLSSPVCVEDHVALDLSQANSLAVFVKSRWEGAIWGALAGALPPVQSRCGRPAGGMLSLVILSAPAEGHQPHVGLFPYPRASSGPPGRSHQLWRNPGLQVAWARVAAWAAAILQPAAVPARASSEEWGTYTRGITAPQLLFYCLQEGLWVGAGWRGRGWSRRNLQCQAGSVERWLSGRDSTG